MAEIRFRAFFSCSFAPEDRELLEFFKQIVASFDIEPVLYDYQEIGRISDGVKEEIVASDCLIAIATRRDKIEGSDQWTSPEWIQHEVALANAFGKPIAIFAEDEVRVEGLIAAEERQQRFDRADLLAHVPKIAAFLSRLRRYLERTYQMGMHEAPVLLRHYIHSHEEISQEFEVHRAEILMEALVDELEATEHEVELEETTPGLSVKQKEFDFRCLEGPAGTRVTPHIVLDTDYRFLWKVVFDPPLAKGEKVKYAFKQTFPNNRPFTYEELIARIDEGTYEYEEPVCEGCEWTIVYPTYELQHILELPDNYEIRSPHPDVVHGAARLEAPDEVARLKEGNMFNAEKLFDRWIIELNVKKPLLNHTYYTFYVPAP